MLVDTVKAITNARTLIALIANARVNLVALLVPLTMSAMLVLLAFLAQVTLLPQRVFLIRRMEAIALMIISVKCSLFVGLPLKSISMLSKRHV
jgi:hypothetical protein